MFNPINFQYEWCVNPSDPRHRNAYPDVTTYQNGTSSCSPNVGLAPGLYSPPTLNDIAVANEKAVNKLDSTFLNGFYKPAGTPEVTMSKFSNTTLQPPRPAELFQNAWITKAAEAFNVLPDPTFSVFFSDANIEHLRTTIVRKVKEITSDSGVAGSKEGVTIMKPNMDDFFNFMINMYQNYISRNGSICFVNFNRPSNIQEEIGKLNTSVLQDYISKMVSQINMYIYYYRDASQLPEQLSVPTMTSMKGSRSLEYNTGLVSGNSIGVASYNEVGNIY
jgi:hypothetical protein